jgi:uncharacterized protein YwgA
MEALERIGIMVEIARRKRDRPGRLGKTSMLKLMYLLQEALGVPLGYRFSLYTYGPYDSGVMSDIDYADAIGVLSVTYEGDQGYRIAEGPSAGQPGMPSNAAEALNRLLTAFGDLNARDLELRSTVHFVFQETGLHDQQLIAVVQDIKPKYSPAEIESAVNDLKKKGILSPPACRNQRRHSSSLRSKARTSRSITGIERRRLADA